MRTIEIKAGPIDVRTDEATGRVCLVFEATDAEMRFFRLMPREEARAFYKHLGNMLHVEGPR